MKRKFYTFLRFSLKKGIGPLIVCKCFRHTFITKLICYVFLYKSAVEKNKNIAWAPTSRGFASK